MNVDPLGRVVVACYAPKAGREDELHAMVREHVPRPRAERLVTDRQPDIAVAR